MEWNFKQSKQRTKTLNLKHVLHDGERRAQLRKQSKEFKEEGKRLKDLLEDGK